jgi:hypothetical protein
MVDTEEVPRSARHSLQLSVRKQCPLLCLGVSVKRRAGRQKETTSPPSVFAVGSLRQRFALIPEPRLAAGSR